MRGGVFASFCLGVGCIIVFSSVAVLAGGVLRAAFRRAVLRLLRINFIGFFVRHVFFISPRAALSVILVHKFVSALCSLICVIKNGRTKNIRCLI